MTNHPAFDVYFIFQKQELKFLFTTPTHAAAYQTLNREARIFTHEPCAVYLPLSPSMTYLRDSSTSGLVIGFTTPQDAESWCRTSVLGHIYASEPSTEVRIRRAWTEEELDEVLHLQKHHHHHHQQQHQPNGFRDSVPLPLRPAMAPNTPPSGSRSRPSSGQFAPPAWAQVSSPNSGTGSGSGSGSPPLSSHQAYSPEGPASKGSHTAYRASRVPSDSIQHVRESQPSVEVEHLDVPPLRVGHVSGGAHSASVH
ncbi:uncharacterized protein BO80DRAFT_427331 [Aspergillus ibericus CBS 121593]|uniref:Uncharacterized protein n=1 Tax=Aspergillus ibericus CBS 121593 TaxID=1448316 RepID=A0A395GT05_9EURO|nr:hypothetical protein BO80DRAFT_427331 [Aspergillus ibericus CBS 121593]RAK98522.1 hypothetical protein BO80DRAFT_427331 [Aspergillus ibericus CBS 121593]